MNKRILSLMVIASTFLLTGEVFGADEAAATEPIIDTGASAWMLIFNGISLAYGALIKL